MHGLLRASHMLADPRQRCMVLHGGGAAGRLQWWTPSADRQLSALEVVTRNVSASLPALGGSSADDKRRSYRDTAAAGGAALAQVSLAAISAPRATR